MRDTEALSRRKNLNKGSTAQLDKQIRREIFRQGKIWKAKEYWMSFELFKPQNWRKRSGETRGHNCAVLPKIHLTFFAEYDTLK